MVVNNKININVLEKNSKDLENYSFCFFNNLYSCFIKGFGFDISKYQKKTVYRLKNNAQELGFILEKEDLNAVKIFFLEKLELLEENKNKNRQLLKKDWIKHEVVFFVYMLQKIHYMKVLEKILNKNIDVNEIEENLINTFFDYNFDYRKTLVKVFGNKRTSYIKKPVTLRKKKNGTKRNT